MSLEKESHIYPLEIVIKEKASDSLSLFQYFSIEQFEECFKTGEYLPKKEDLIVVSYFEGDKFEAKNINDVADFLGISRVEKPYRIKNEIWSPQNFIEQLFGYYPITNHIEVSDRVFVENEIVDNGYNLRSFNLGDINTIVNNDINVALVECLDEVGQYEYIWFEVPDDFNDYKYCVAEELSVSNVIEVADYNGKWDIFT